MATTPPKPTKRAIKAMERKYDPYGKIVNWSIDWPEAQELSNLVATGIIDGLTPAQVREKFPHFAASSTSVSSRNTMSSKSTL